MPLGSIDASHTNVPKHLDLWSVVGQRTSGRSAGPGEHGRLGRFHRRRARASVLPETAEAPKREV